MEVYGRADVALVTAGEAAELDRHAREVSGVPERVLMENAGRAAAQLLTRLFPRGRVLAVVGRGHNGGDALVALRSLRAWGRDVAWLAAGEPPSELLTALAHGFSLPRVQSGAAAAAALATADVLIDGILGTGAAGAPRGAAAALIREMNASGKPVLALDLPSGVDPTTGVVPAEAVLAAATVCFGWPKTGLLLQPARSYCGRLLAVEIGFPPPAASPAAALITPGWAAVRLGARAPESHKTSVGRLLIVAGCEGMAGAAVLAGRGASRAGAGLVRLVSPESNRTILQTAVPEAVFTARHDTAALAAAAAENAALVIGPGMGVDAAARDALDAVLAASPGRPVLLDADALTMMGGEAGSLRRLAAERPVLITPHPGEMQRLTGRPVEEIRATPLQSARELAEECGAVVLLKGSPSVVAAPDSPVLVNSVGSSDLASAGMGDTLAGAAGAFMAAGSGPAQAAALALFFTGRAADICCRGRALLPEDLAERLDAAFAAPGEADPPFALPFVTFDQPPRR